MVDDRPPGNVELLDEWDDDETPRPRRRTKTWLMGPLALVAIAAIVVAVVLGGTRQDALDPVPTELPTAPTPTALSYPSYSYVTVDASSGSISVGPDPAYTLEPIPSDAEAEPLLVTLLGKAERTDAMIVGFRLQICLRGGSAAAGGGKVRVSRNGWMLGLGTSSISPVSSGGLAPEFPETAFLDAGQCVSGYVTFPLVGDAKYIFLYYGDERFTWSWRVS